MTTQVLIAKDLTLTANPANPIELQEGELRAFDIDGNVILDVQAAGNVDKLMYFALGSAAGEAPIISKHFYGRDIVDYKKEPFDAGKVQITTIGFNGTAGDLGVAGATGGSIKLIDISQGYEPFKRITADVANKETPVAAATAAVALLNANSKVSMSAAVLVDLVSPELVNSTTTGTPVTFTVTQGSKAVTATVINTESIGDLVAGEYIRIGDPTDKSNPVYKVASIGAASGTSQVVILETPFQGATATGVAAGRIAAAPSPTDAAGIQITGSSVTQSFQTALAGDFAGVSLTATQAPDGMAGADTAKMTELERKNFGTFGFYETNYLPQTPPSRVESGVDYALYWLHIKNDNDRNVLRENQVSRICIALDSTAADETILPILS